jgi:hypothetical protein
MALAAQTSLRQLIYPTDVIPRYTFVAHILFDVVAIRTAERQHSSSHDAVAFRFSLLGYCRRSTEHSKLLVCCWPFKRQAARSDTASM